MNSMESVEFFSDEGRNNVSLGNSSSSDAFEAYFKTIKDQFEENFPEGMFNYRFYMLSVYGIACLFMALVLNRTMLLASRVNQGRMGGRDPRSSFSKRVSKGVLLLLRLTVIASLIYDVYLILVILNLNGSIRLPEGTRWWLYDLIPDKFFEYDPEYYDNSIYMASSKNLVMIGPTGNVNWLFFMSVCFSVFVETLIASLEDRTPLTEGGFTIFELSVCYHSEVGGSFIGKTSSQPQRPGEPTLLISLYVILNHISIHIGSLLNGNKHRLIPSSIFSLSFFAYWYSVLREGNFFAFPYIVYPYCMPQVSVLIVIFISIIIASVAFIANGLTFQDLRYINLLCPEEEEDPDFRAQVFNIKWDDDFYTFLINVGEVVVKSATKTSYVSELSLVNLYKSTWLERDIMRKLEEEGKQATGRREIKNRGEIGLKYANLSRIGLGYENVITNPPSDVLVNSKGSDVFDNKSRYTTIRYRFTRTKPLVVGLFQLLRGLFSMYVGRVFWYIMRPIRRVLVLIGIISARSNNNHQVYIPPLVGGLARESRQENLKSTIEVIEPAESDDDWDDLDYVKLLTGPDLQEIDKSADYIDLPESDSEAGTDTESVDLNAASNQTIQDLFSDPELQEFVSSTSIEILHNHLNQENRHRGTVTRAKHRAILAAASPPDVVQRSSDDVLKLARTLVERRPNLQNTASDAEGKYDCVVCQVNCREIITWPCKCLAICDQCRISLLAKGLDTCVCCRKKVDGVSKIYVP